MIAEYQDGGSVPCYRCTGLKKTENGYVCAMPARWNKNKRPDDGPVDIHDVPMLPIGIRGCAGGNPKRLEQS